MNGLINTQLHNSPGISIALIFITVGIGFKLSPALFQDLQDHAGEIGAVKTQNELVAIKLMLRKFNFSSSKLNEILTIGKRDPGKGGIGYVDKGKATVKSLTVSVKASNHKELGECSTKPMLIGVVKKVGWLYVKLAGRNDEIIAMQIYYRQVTSQIQLSPNCIFYRTIN
ncbi:hypothetical protein PVK06_010819 [Gossypium arboreum]|uniref:Uncharacterized protein n=1 Tax=Gossypium arboreum TaxID=29729 RepID=A0ABR0Q8B8_GOSAR|nr:hypothetical protein PVK06_010819 [Gossypium arboreum]